MAASKKFDIKAIATKALALGGGSIAADMVTGAVGADFSPEIQGGIKIIAGAMIPELMKKGTKSNPMIENVGNGMIANGASQLVNTLLGDQINGIFGQPALGYTNYGMPKSENGALGSVNEFETTKF